MIAPFSVFKRDFIFWGGRDEIMKKKYKNFILFAIIYFFLFFGAGVEKKVEAASNNWAWPTYLTTIQNDWPCYSSGNYHGGTDFPVSMNTPVYSTCDGEVVSVQSLTSSYGKHIKIKAVVNGNVVYMRYCHLNSFAVSTGEKVSAGQLIGYSGSTGNSTGPHLHYEVRNANDYYGNAGSPNLNPRNYLPGSSLYFETNYQEDVKNPMDDGEIVDLGTGFSARIRNVGNGKFITENNGNLVLESKKNDKLAEQIWKFEKNSDGSYSIISSIDSTCFDLDNYSDTDGANIHLWDNNRTSNQKWFIHRLADGTYYFRPSCSQTKVMDLYNNNSDDGTNIQLYTYNASNAQKYYIDHCSEIVNDGDVFSAFIMNHSYWKPIMQDDKNNVVLGTEKKDNMNRTLWKFERDSAKGYYRIYSYYNNWCLDVNNQEDEDGTNVKCYPEHNSNAQKWYILRGVNGRTYMKPACSSRVLDVTNNEKDDGTNIQLWTRNETAAQEFTLYKLDENRDKIEYQWSSKQEQIKINNKITVSINKAPYAISYKIHIIDPDGKETVIDNKCNSDYVFTAKKIGKYILFAEVKSPVSFCEGSKTKNAMEISVKPYEIHYILNGGINNESNPDKFEGKEIVLENPQRRGYEFEGWYQESTYNNKVVSIPENTNADQTIYAKWKKILLEVPQNVEVKNGGDLKITISFNNVEGAKGYKIEYAEDKSFLKNKKTISTTKTNYTTPQLKQGVKYYVRIRAYQPDSSQINVYSEYTEMQSVVVQKELIELNKSNLSFNNLNQSYQLRATVNPDKKVTWESTEETVASVDSNGLVRINGYGKAIITAKTVSGSSAECNINVLPTKSKIQRIISDTSTSLELQWTQIDHITGYEIYRSKIENGVYTKIKTITDTTINTYRNAGLETGTKYFYKIRAYVTVGAKKVYGTYSDIVSATPVPNRVSVPKVTAVECDSITLQWTGMNGITGYEIYRNEKESGNYQKICTITGYKNVTYKDTGLIAGKMYYYKIRAYRTINGKNVYGVFSAIINKKPVPMKGEIKSITPNGSKSLKIVWEKNPSVTGYELYRCTKKTGTYKKLAEIQGENRCTLLDKSLQSGTTYYYKIRAYKSVGGSKIYGVMSPIKSGIAK